MKNFSAVLATFFFSFFLFSSAAMAEKKGFLDPTNDPWESVMIVNVLEQDEWGCQTQSGFSQQYMKYVKRRVCPYVDFFDFEKRLNPRQRKLAIELGMEVLREELPKYISTQPREMVELTALRKAYTKITGLVAIAPIA